MDVWASSLEKSAIQLHCRVTARRSSTWYSQCQMMPPPVSNDLLPLFCGYLLIQFVCFWRSTLPAPILLSLIHSFKSMISSSQSVINHRAAHTHPDTHTCSRSVMRVSVAYIGRIAVSSPSLALGGLSCPAELQRAQGTKDGVCSPIPLHPHWYFFNHSPSFCKKDLRESVSGGSKGECQKLPPLQNGNIHH